MVDEDRLAIVADAIARQYGEVNQRALKRLGKRLADIKKMSKDELIAYQATIATCPDIDVTTKEVRRLSEQTAYDLAAVFGRMEVSATHDATMLSALRKNAPLLDMKRLHGASALLYADVAESIQDRTRSVNASQLFYTTIGMAVILALDGKLDFSDIINDVATKGLQVVYPSGTKRRLDSAIRQNVFDGITAANRKMQSEIGLQLGTDGVEISAHLECALDHEPFQGCRYSHAEYAHMQESLDRPFLLWNCRHFTREVYMGVGRPTYTAGQLAAWAAINNNGLIFEGNRITLYEAAQVKRNIKTEIRKQRDIKAMARAAGESALERKARNRLAALETKYEALLQAWP
jgi:hypothetical protein